MMVGIEDLPNELLEYLLFHVHQETLRLNCVYVSKSWRSLIQCVPFWKRYHRHWEEGRGSIPDEIFMNNNDWRFFSLINSKTNPFERNLLKNADGNLVSVDESNAQNNRYFEDGFTKPWPEYPFWKILSSGGRGWLIQKSLSIETQKSNEELVKICPSGCFVASYHSCSKSQSIDLLQDYGVSREILHNPKYQFDINIKEWHFMKGPCRYELIVRLLDEDGKVIQETECDSKHSIQFEKGIWGKIHRKITVCGVRRLRFITFYHGATCNQPVPTVDDNGQVAADDWADVCTKMTGGSVFVSYPIITKLSKEEQMYSNRYIVYPRFADGKTWSTVDSFGPLGNNTFSLGSLPVTASM